MSIFSDPGFLIPFSLLQVLVLLLVVWAVDVYEREPMPLVAAMALWGAIVAPALVIAFRGPVFDVLSSGTDGVRRAMMAALIEEPAKGLALVAIVAGSWALSKQLGVMEFEGVSDGAVYGAAIGLGFAFTENLFYLVQQDSIATGLTVLVTRSDFGGLSMLAHAVYTGTFGIGLGLATMQRGLLERVALGVAGLAAAVTMHAVHNGLWAQGSETAGRAADYGFVVLFVAAIAGWLLYQRGVLLRTLAAEWDDGLLLEDERQRTAHPMRMLRSNLAHLRAGEADQVRADLALHRELVELVFARHRVEVLGADEGKEPLSTRRQRVAHLRELAALARRSDTRVPPSLRLPL